MAKTTVQTNVSGIGITGQKAATTAVRTGSAARAGSANKDQRSGSATDKGKAKPVAWDPDTNTYVLGLSACGDLMPMASV